MKLKGIITQSVANTTILTALSTSLVVSGKTGWQINEFKGFFLLGGFPITDSSMTLSLQTEVTAQLHGSPDLIARVGWVQKAAAAGAAGTMQVPYVLTDALLGRITVQPLLQVSLQSVALSSVASVGYEIDYDVVKLTDLEVMTMMIGGV